MQIERLIKIIFLLIRKEHSTAQEIADYLEVSKRTILRDLNTLSLAGIPIYSSKGNGGGVGILKEYTIDKTVLSKAEQDNIIHGLQVLKATKLPTTEQTLNKIGSLFKQAARPNWIEVDFSFWGSNEKEKIRFEALEKAILNKHVITFDYHTSELQHNTRVVEPLRLLFKEHSWYIQGYCTYKKAFRTFRTSRMKNLKITDTFFERELPQDLPSKPDYSQSYEMKTLKLKFSPEIAHMVYDEYVEDCVTIDSDGYYHVTWEYAINEWLIRHLLSFGTHVEVLEPAEIQQMLRDRAEEIVKIYS